MHIISVTDFPLFCSNFALKCLILPAECSPQISLIMLKILLAEFIQTYPGHHFRMSLSEFRLMFLVTFRVLSFVTISFRSRRCFNTVSLLGIYHSNYRQLNLLPRTCALCLHLIRQARFRSLVRDNHCSQSTRTVRASMKCE